MKFFFRGLKIGLCIGIPLIALFFLSMEITEDHAIKSEKPSISYVSSLPEDSMVEETLPEADDLEELVEPIPESSSVLLSFTGDVYFSEHYLEQYDRGGITALADEEMRTFMADADLLMFNEEFPFSQSGEPMEDKTYTFRTDPNYVKIFQAFGVDVVSIANNHILDFGRQALLDTLDTLNTAGIDYAGGGLNLSEAVAPVVKTVSDQTFAIFAATRVSPSYDWYASKNQAGILQTYDPTVLNQAIQEAESLYDHIIVFVHWGIERNETPEEYQRTLAKGYIDAGADLIVGCHPHVLQGFEFYKGVPIVYSLGNYLFGNRTGETVLLNATFSKTEPLELQLIPCKRVDGVLKRMTEPSAMFSHLTELSFGVGITSDGILVSLD